jgi:hypothetical protein
MNYPYSSFYFNKVQIRSPLTPLKKGGKVKAPFLMGFGGSRDLVYCPRLKTAIYFSKIITKQISKKI